MARRQFYGALGVVAAVLTCTAPAEAQVRKAPIVRDATALCDRHIKSGDVLEEPPVVPSSGHSVVVHNGSEAHAVIKILRPDGARELYFAGPKAVVRSLPLDDGVVQVQYAFGGRLAADCQTVIRPDSLGKLPPEKLITRTTDKGTYTREINYTLFRVKNGNVVAKSISAAEFNRD